MVDSMEVMNLRRIKVCSKLDSHFDYAMYNILVGLDPDLAPFINDADRLGIC
jgi:hypothetical protein